MSNNEELQYLDMVEEPPAGSGKVKDYCNASRLTKVRHWLIEKLAGEQVVILNAHLRLIPRLEDKTVVGRTLPEGKGMLISGSNFYCGDKDMMLIQNNRAVVKV